eukprot:m.1144041 g.1144041  ORF g.1144041 m.1144041 type:complete len:55 (-) comp24461_c0_seq10:2187-2351(-)
MGQGGIAHVCLNKCVVVPCSTGVVKSFHGGSDPPLGDRAIAPINSNDNTITSLG